MIDTYCVKYLVRGRVFVLRFDEPDICDAYLRKLQGTGCFVAAWIETTVRDGN